MRLAARLLDRAGDVFGDHGCNDFDLFEEMGIDRQAAIELDRLVHENNGDPEMHDPEWAARGTQSDFCLMYYMSSRLEQEAESPEDPDIPTARDKIRTLRDRLAIQIRALSHEQHIVIALCSRLGITREDAERLVGP
jgi:hypothetical protein